VYGSLGACQYRSWRRPYGGGPPPVKTMLPPALRLLPDPLPPGVPGDPGLFGPGSSYWHIGRERVLLLGGQAALLLQLAHPLVAAGVAAHSRFQADPLRRLRATLSATLTVTFGDAAQARAAAARVAAVHRRVRGRLARPTGPFPAGTPYRASDPATALWVHATLVVTALEVFDRFVAPLDHGDREAYYQESKRSAAMFAVTPAMLPATYDDFCAYVGDVHAAVLAVGPAARAAAGAVLATPRQLPLRLPAALAAPLTAGLLPAPLREAFGLDWGLRAQAHASLAGQLLRAMLPVLPPVARYWPHYLVAARRMAARPAALVPAAPPSRGP